MSASGMSVRGMMHVILYFIPIFLFYILTFLASDTHLIGHVRIFMRVPDALFGNGMLVGEIAKVESVSLQDSNLALKLRGQHCFRTDSGANAASRRISQQVAVCQLVFGESPWFCV